MRSEVDGAGARGLSEDVKQACRERSKKYHGRHNYGSVKRFEKTYGQKKTSESNHNGNRPRTFWLHLGHRQKSAHAGIGTNSLQIIRRILARKLINNYPEHHQRRDCDLENTRPTYGIRLLPNFRL